MHNDNHKLMPKIVSSVLGVNNLLLVVFVEIC